MAHNWLGIIRAEITSVTSPCLIQVFKIEEIYDYKWIFLEIYRFLHMVPLI